MDITTSSIKSTSSPDSCSKNILAKLRRLKIQEELLLQNIKKHISNESNDENCYQQLCVHSKQFITNVKDSFTTIKILFEDIKSATRSEETLKCLDINEIKSDVLQLENKIKSFKMFLQSEQASLKQEEHDLTRTMNDNSNQNSKIKVLKKTTKTFSDIIPSPVKNIIKSPFKCPEVQRFQEFLSGSNRCGGWNEYHHNIFIKLWDKNNIGHNADATDHSNLDGKEYNKLIDDIHNSVPGLKQAEIISHIKWYSRYLYLKSRQKHALDEWKTKTRALKAPHGAEESRECIKNENVKRNCSCNPKPSGNCKKTDAHKTKDFLRNKRESSSSNAKDQQLYNSINANEYLKEVKRSLGTSGCTDEIETFSYGFAKPTKQWDIKCNSPKEPLWQEHSIEHITKLGIPVWRLGLHENIMKKVEKVYKKREKIILKAITKVEKHRKINTQCGFDDMSF